MSIVHSSLIDAPIELVFEWHGRPGAFTRLSPPWQPIRIVEEATSLSDGRAVLRLPGGMRWVAQHDPSGYDPPRAFVDELISFPLRSVVPWRHQHQFSSSEGATVVTDRLTTPVPARLLRPMFVYRHRQLADDLAAQKWALDRGATPSTVAVTGASGLIGGALVAFLSTAGHRVIRLVRHAPQRPDERQWSPDDPAGDLLADVDAVVHLAGAGIAGRFNQEHKQAIYDSRIGPTRRLAELAAQGGPRVLVTASAVGFYGADRGDEILTEASGRGDGFLAEVVADWEQATAPAADGGLRVVQIRTGIVQSPRGGTLRLLYPLFAAGLGGRLGSGRQWLPWIGIDDLVDIYQRALFDDALSGPLNAVAPAPVRNLDYTRTLARVLHRPAVFPVPGFGPQLLLGREGARELAEASQRATPQRLVELDHPFRHPQLEGALRHLLGHDPGGAAP